MLEFIFSRFHSSDILSLLCLETKRIEDGCPWAPPYSLDHGSTFDQRLAEACGITPSSTRLWLETEVPHFI